MAHCDSPSAPPRLRFDKVALRLVRGVRGALEEAVPDGRCVIFAVTAPIREPSKTQAALIETIRARLSLRAEPGEHVAALHGNVIRVRVVTSRLPHAARMVGFVHNPDPPPGALLDMAQSLLECIEAPDVATGNGTAPNLEPLRSVCAQVGLAINQQRARATSD